MVRKESADTQESESYQLNGMDVDMNENKEELSFHTQCGDQDGWMT